MPRDAQAMTDSERDAITPVFDQAQMMARSLVDAGYMPLSHYLDCCRQFGWRVDRPHPVLRVVAGEAASAIGTIILAASGLFWAVGFGGAS